MPITSSEVAAQIGMFQQQQMMFAQNGNLISDAIQRSVDPQSGSNFLAGRAINAGVGAATPLVGLGLGMAGLDPLSGGLRAGMAVGGRFGVGAGIAAGGLTAGALGGVGMAASYAFGQMHMGAQAQQGFNTAMRSGFNFMTPHGQGFSNQQLGVMGQQVRSMSGQIGANGEMMGFGELTNMAANMGRMGMGTGVRDFQEFNRRFKEMVGQATQMAKDLGTTLEGAQQQMAQMKNSGVFRASDQMKMSGEMRTFSLGGNLSMNALNQAASFGSQISRAVGGRGRAGAFAGVRTLGQVGMAVESGVLSEEDIYNATGLTGEEGKSAFAASQLQSSASWLRGGKGRRFLASIAGANGKLDPRSVEAWMSGDMSTGDTMSQAHRNLAGMGRADFIRNEGRLRGEALSQFGGNIPAMALMQWAGRRGIDINSMDDRSMLLAQRHTGLGMEELEGAVKMLQNMPSIKEQGRITEAMDARRMEITSHRRNSGVEGVRRKLEHTREHIQNKLQGVGQQMYSDLTEYIEDSLNKMSGTILQQASADIDKTYQRMLKGDKGAAAQFGLGNSNMRQYTKGLETASGAATGGLDAKSFDSKLPFGTSMRDRVTASGFGSFFGKGTDFAAGSRQLQEAARGMGNFGNQEARSLGKNLSGVLGAGYAAGIAEKKGAERFNAVRQLLEQNGSADAKALLAQMSSSSTETEKAYAALASAEMGMGLGEKNMIGAASQLPGGLGLVGGGGMTDNERTRHYGELALGRQKGGGGTAGLLSKIGLGAGATGGLGLMAAAGPLGLLAAPMAAGIAGLGAGAGYLAGKVGSAFGLVTDPSADTTAFGGYLRSKEGLSMSRSILGGSDMAESLRGQINAISGDGAAEKRQREQLRSMLASNNLMQAAIKQGRSVTDFANLNPDEVARIEKEAGITRKGAALDTLKAAYGASTDQQKIDLREASVMFGKAALSSQQRGQAAGYLDQDGNLSAATRERIRKTAGDKGLALASKMVGLEGLQAKGARAGTSNEELVTLNENVAKESTSLTDDMYGASIADLRKLAQAEREAGNFGAAEQIGTFAGARDRGERTLRRRGNAGAAGLLGLKVKWQDVQVLNTAKAGDGRLAAYLSNQFGVGSEAGIEQELKQLENSGMSSEAISKRRTELQGNLDLAKKFSAADKETDIAKKNRILDEIRSDPEFKKKEEERQKKQDMNDPNLRLLTGIKEAIVDLKKPLAAVAGKAGGGTDDAPQPGGK